MAGSMTNGASMQQCHGGGAVAQRGLHRSDRRGYTFVELMIAVIIVGLLAAIVTPRLSFARQKAYIATMKSDLRNFAQSQESYFYDNSVYTSSLGFLSSMGFQMSDQVSVAIIEATDTGWAAIVNHAMSPIQCSMFLGTASPVGAAVEEGVVSCT